MDPKRYGRRAVIVYRCLIDPLVQPLRPKIVELCLRHNVRRILDVGCATGEQCRQLGIAGVSAVGLDLSEEMIAAAKERPQANVDYVVGCAFELPFGSSTFDATLLSLALHEHPEDDRTRMLEEARRVIAPGGILMIAEYTRPANPIPHIPWCVIQLVETLAGKKHRDGFREFIASDGLDGLIRRHGFRLIERQSSHFSTLTIAVVRVGDTQPS